MNNLLVELYTLIKYAFWCLFHPERTCYNCLELTRDTHLISCEDGIGQVFTCEYREDVCDTPEIHKHLMEEMEEAEDATN